MAATGAATIVVVEQSAAMQELIDQALRDNGDFLLITQNPLEALDLARRVHIDLLITEFGDSGLALVDEVRSLQPDLRVLYLYGEGDEPVPVGLGELPARVEESLAER
jgi:DNA-binding NarL/FixJ family response regulator